MNLGAYILRRLLMLVPVLFGALTLTFFVTRVIPADPVGAILGPQAPPELVDKVRREWGFDKPLHEQFVNYILGVVRGDWGRALRTGRPVLRDILEVFPATLELATAALFVSVAVGVPLGLVAALKKDTWVDHVVRAFITIGSSTPAFWLGLMMLLLFYHRLGWLPGPGRLDTSIPPPPRITGMVTIDSLLAGRFDAFANAIAHLVMPASVLGWISSAGIARITRSSVLEVLSREHVRAARAKGLAEKLVVTRHVLRNALVPVVTVIGVTYGGLLEGAVMTETVFSWPGLGRYSTNALLGLDYMAITGATMFVALVYSIVNLATDIVYAYLDPRIRYG
jgi:peptide/nickel transport system permease protein